MILNPKETAKIYGPKKTARPLEESLADDDGSSSRNNPHDCFPCLERGPEEREMKQTNKQRAFLLATKLCTGRGRPPEIPEWIDWAAKKILRAMNDSRRAAKKERN